MCSVSKYPTIVQIKSWQARCYELDFIFLFTNPHVMVFLEELKLSNMCFLYLSPPLPLFWHPMPHYFTNIKREMDILRVIWNYINPWTEQEKSTFLNKSNQNVHFLQSHAVKTQLCRLQKTKGKKKIQEQEKWISIQSQVINKPADNSHYTCI